MAWTAPSRWTDMDYLRNLSTRQTPVHRTHASSAFDPTEGPAATISVPWAAAVDLALRPSAHDGLHYYLKSDLTEELRADLVQFPDALLGLPARGESLRPCDAKVWVGGASAVTPLHFDMAHAIVAQVPPRPRAARGRSGGPTARATFPRGELSARAARRRHPPLRGTIAPIASGRFNRPDSGSDSESDKHYYDHGAPHQ